MLLGRRSECAALDELMHAVRAGQSRVLVLRGEPGVGKTALLEDVADPTSGFRFTRAAGVESEMELVYAGVYQLCEPLLGRLDRLPAPQHAALETAFGLSAGGPPDPFLIGLAVLSLLSNTAEDQPLLCVVDSRVLEINQAEVELVLAMNRLRHAYLEIAPALAPYFSTSHHDDEQGLAASYLLARFQGGGLGRWRQLLADTPTVIGTVDAALAAAIVVLAVRAAHTATTVAVAAGTAAFLVVWTALFLLERHTQDPLRRTTPRFPTPPTKPQSTADGR